MDSPTNRFTSWLNLTMESCGLSQAGLARAIGVADTQVSRWRRGQVVPTVHSLQRIADVFGVPRATLDRLAGYPIGEDPEQSASEEMDPALQAQLQVYQAWYRQLLEQQVPHSLWRVYTEGCAALAEALSTSWNTTVGRAQQEIDADLSEAWTEVPEAPPRKDNWDIGFHP